MGNALLFTGLLLGAAVLGGFIGSCCSKGRQAGDHEGRIAELEDRLDALADHVMDEAKRLRTEVSDVDIRADELHDHYLDLKRLLAEQNDRLNECELLIGDTPTGGLLGRVSALEDLQKVNDEEHRVLRDVMLALNKHGHGCVVGLDAELSRISRTKEAQGER